MSENRELEILMQQKMEAFRLEPAPADWQAIHDRLHPKKDRRFFWWWFPLLGALLAGGYWFTQQQKTFPSSSTKATINPASIKAGSEKAPFPSTEKETTVGQPGMENTGTGIPTATASANEKKSDTKVMSHDKAGQFSVSTPEKSSAISQQRTTENSGKTDKRNGLKGNAMIYPSSEIQQPPERVGAETANTSLALMKVDNSHLSHILPGPAKSPDPAAMKTKITLVPPAVQPVSQITPAEVKKSIPVAAPKPEKGWFWGAYAGAGWNLPKQPTSMAKSADASAPPPAGNYNTGSTSSTNSGLHYSAGLLIEKKAGKFSMSFGLGLQHNAWSSLHSTYIDSEILLSGTNRPGRYTLTKRQTDYRQFALEVPLNINFRLANNGPSSFWIGTGLNNVFTLGLTQHSASTNLLFSSDVIQKDSTLTSSANRYQPQLRLGLTYEHANAKHQWQVAPLLQYGLNGMMKNGDPDIHMLHLELQFRYFISPFR